MTAALSIRRVTSSDQADYIEVRFDDENGRRVAAATMSLEAFGLAVTGRSEVPVELVMGAPSPSPGLAAVERLRDLVTCLLENEPDDYAADGVTVLEVWRQAARAALSAPRPSQPKGETP